MSFYLGGSNSVDINNQPIGVTADAASPEVVSIGAVGDAAVVDPGVSASMIALLKGLLTLSDVQQLTYVAETALTAVGVTAAQEVDQYRNATVTADVSGVGTDVVLDIEGSVDGTNFFSLLANDTPRTVSADGLYSFALSPDVVAPLTDIRGELVSFTGGTPSVTYQIAVH